MLLIGTFEYTVKADVLGDVKINTGEYVKFRVDDADNVDTPVTVVVTVTATLLGEFVVSPVVVGTP
jgi:hypothetical protein